MYQGKAKAAASFFIVSMAAQNYGSISHIKDSLINRRLKNCQDVTFWFNFHIEQGDGFQHDAAAAVAGVDDKNSNNVFAAAAKLCEFCELSLGVVVGGVHVTTECHASSGGTSVLCWVWKCSAFACAVPKPHRQRRIVVELQQQL
jgi:hypothetical protein